MTEQEWENLIARLEELAERLRKALEAIGTKATEGA